MNPTNSIRLMDIRYLAVVAFSILLAGCINPPRVTSKAYAIENATAKAMNSDFEGVICRLPSNRMDGLMPAYYDLFARLPVDSPAQYFMSVVTAGEFFHGDAEVVALNGPRLKVLDRRDFSAIFDSQVDYIEVEYSRDYLEKVAVTGARFQVTSSRGSRSFDVSNWMFAALLEVADEHEEYAKRRRSEELEVRAISESFQTVDNSNDTTGQEDPFAQAAYGFTDLGKNRVIQSFLRIGMMRDSVRVLCGLPEKVVCTINYDGHFEQWIYANCCLYFTDDALTSWEDISEY